MLLRPIVLNMVEPIQNIEVQLQVPVAPVYWNPPGTQLDDVAVIKNILPFLRTKRMKALRSISCIWNYSVLNWPTFQRQLKGDIRGIWYRKASGFNFEITPVWNSLRLHHFQFYRHSSQFRVYWQNSAKLLSTLNIQRVSLECDGFKFLLNNCPLLRTLTLDICQLRDIDDHHGPNQKPPPGGFCLPPVPTSQHLLHLNLKSIYRIEECFMNYLIERTGNLETLQIASCFNPLSQNDKSPKIPFPEAELKLYTERYNEFEGNLFKLLEKNQDKLTEFTFTQNYYHTSFFKRMVARAEMFNIQTLTLEVNTPDPNLTYYTAMIQFSNRCPRVDTLNIKFQKNISSSALRQFLKPHQTTLKKLYISVRGDNIVTPLNLDFLKNFLALDDLEIEDTKPVIFKKIRPIIGGNRAIPPNSIEDSSRLVTELITTFGSRINPSFMNALPPELKKLGLNHYITSTDPLHPIDPSIAAWQSLRKLSKLEIRGPWILTITGIIAAISKELSQLETLALTACGLQDVHLTGLDDSIVLDMFNCITAGIEVFRRTPYPTGEEVTSAVHERMKPENLVHIHGSRSRLSDLTKLKNLDLSLNSGVSDVSLFDALRSPRIKALNFYSCAKISDDGMHFLTLYNPELEVLNVKHCRKVTKRGLSKLVDGCYNLKTVYSTKAPAFTRKTVNEEGMIIQVNPRYEDIVVTTDEKYVTSSTTI